MRYFAVVFLLVCALPATASSNGAWQAFLDGNYDDARILGENSKTAEGLTIACRSSLVIAGFLTKDKSAAPKLHTAIKDCIAAYETDPLHFNAQMSLAIALSFEGKRTRKTVYPKQARLLLEDLVAKHPNNALAYGALAAWHSQVSAAGFFARVALKASRKRANALFQAAFGKGAIDFPLKMEYLKFLAQGSKKERRHALIYAEQLAGEVTHNAFDTLLQKKCLHILDALRTGKKKQIRSAVKEASAFNAATGWEKHEPFPKEQLLSIQTGE